MTTPEKVDTTERDALRPSSATWGAFVPGKPAPQGSKRHVGNGILVESSKAVKPWRQDIREQFLTAEGKPRVRFDQGVSVHVFLTFLMPRPSGMAKGRPAPAHTKRPDIDKLTRAVLDALGSAGVWHDDSQVTRVNAAKAYTEFGGTPGCWISVVGVDE